MACHWATETEIFTYPCPWHCTLQNLLLNEETVLNFWVEPCVIAVNVLQPWFQITDNQILLIIFIFVFIISILSIIYIHSF